MMGGTRTFWWRRSRRRRGPSAVVALAVLVLAGTACDPVLHPNFRTVEPGPGPVTVAQIANDGRYALVDATAAGATVPGPGRWRVDRHDGTAVALPPSSTGALVSARGSSDLRRYRFVDPATNVVKVWDEGAVVIPPSPLLSLNPPMTKGLVSDPGTGLARVWDVETGATAGVEDPYPRPPTHPTLSDSGVSTDGNVVWLKLTGSGGCMTRIIFVNPATVRDFPDCENVVAQEGTALVRLLEYQELGNSTYGITAGGYLHLELVQTFTGQMVRDLRPLNGGYFDGVRIGPDGWVVWAVEAFFDALFPPDCGVRPNLPRCFATIRGVAAVAASATAIQTFPVDPGISSLGYPQSAQFSISGNGRWMTYAAGANDPAGAPVHVLDRLNGTDEELVGTPSRSAALPLITDDGRVIAFREVAPGGLNGWYEHEAAGSP